MKNAKQEINHLLLMAKLLATQQNDPMLVYFMSMAIDQNRQTNLGPEKTQNAA